MKISILLGLLIGINMCAQTKIYKYDTPLTCAMLVEGITDSVLYKYESNRLIIKPEAWRDNNRIKRLVVNKKEYYISEGLSVKIADVLKTQKCHNIEILPMLTPDEKGVKIVRDKQK